MADIATANARTAAHALLHQLVDHYKSERDLGPNDRVAPEDFFPVDTQLLVKLAGWTLQPVSMVGYTTSGDPLVAKCVKADRNVILLCTLSEEVKRYTLAHELCHMHLHTKIPDCNAGNLPRVTSMLSASDRNRRVEYSDIEREAEVFARELLMPETAVRFRFRQRFGVDRFRAASGLARKFAPRAHQNGHPNPREVAREISKWSDSHTPSLVSFFGVSASAMASRLIGLYLVY